jgi:SAM-dependent methyltransferase
MNPAEFVNIARAEDQMWWFAGMRSILDAWISGLPDARFENVLEGGCGTGYMSRWLAQRYGWRMFPADLDFGGLSYGMREGVARMVQTDITALPYKDESFDAVVSLDVVVHLPKGHEVRALREFLRVLRPGGKLILRVAALEILRSRHSIFANEKQRFGRRGLEESLRLAGFKILDCSYANSFLIPVALFKFRVWEEMTRQEARSGVEVPGEFLNSLLRVPLELEALCLKVGMRFPVGQSLLVLAER